MPQQIMFHILFVLSVFGYGILSFIAHIFTTKFCGAIIGRKILHILFLGSWFIYLYFINLSSQIYITGLILCIVSIILIMLAPNFYRKIDVIIYSLIFLFCIADQSHIYQNSIRLSILCLADGLAPIVAIILRRINIQISAYNKKTLIGSLTVLLVTSLILASAQFAISDIIGIAAVITLVEYISEHDNLSIFLVLLLLI